MVVDLRLRARRPDKDLQREGTVNTFVLAGHIPVCPPASRLLQVRTDLHLEKSGVIDEPGQVESGPPHSKFRGKFREFLQVVHEARTPF
jgi:hypothetical protein